MRAPGQRGFTLMEVVFVAVVLAALARYALPKLWKPAMLTIESQAQTLADTVRRAQTLAMVRRQRMSAAVAVAGANGRFAIACTTGSTPCTSDTSVTFEQGASLAGGTTVYFNSWGVPVDVAGAPLTQAVSFTLAFGTDTYTVAVAPLTGRVTVTR